nr:ABC transporter ATP-binding protein [Methylophaga sp. OBS3]
MIDIHSVNHVVSPGGEPLQILQDVSLQIVRGESAAIVGKSGSGKTTLLGLMAGLDVPTSGAIYLDGEQINTLSEDERAKLRADRVGFVFQSFQLLPSLTALENVLLPLELAGIDYAKQQAMELLEQVGLGNRLQHTPRQLSGGEQQRVAIARAFAVTPRVLFADEPTGNLDTQTGAQITDLLMTLNQQQGTTLVMVTHDDQLAERCDKQFQIDAGRVKTS